MCGRFSTDIFINIIFKMMSNGGQTSLEQIMITYFSILDFVISLSNFKIFLFEQ